MIELMDKTGRIIRLRCEFFASNSGPTFTAQTPDEVVQALLQHAPASEFLRGPYISSEKKASE